MFQTRQDREAIRREASQLPRCNDSKRQQSTNKHPSPKTTDSNGFHLLKTIGQGTQGKCELLQRAGDGVIMVRKRTHPRQKSIKMEGNTPREVKILQDTLRPHPRIINLISYNVGKSGELDTYYDYHAGGDLQHHLQPQTGASEGFIWHVFRQMAEALAYLHCGYVRSDPNKSGKMPHKWRPIVHCDLKPDNIFLSAPPTTENPTPDIILGDFGLAVFDQEISGHGAPDYQPPEYPHNTPAADVWALGATIHQMAHGHVPVNYVMPEGYRGTRREWVTDPYSKRVEPLPGGYSEALNRNMMDCLRIRADERVAAYDLLRHIRRDGPRGG
jgi:serine/threonine protein kinase